MIVSYVSIMIFFVLQCIAIKRVIYYEHDINYERKIIVSERDKMSKIVACILYALDIGLDTLVVRQIYETEVSGRKSTEMVARM